MGPQVIRAVCNRLCRNACINIPFPDTVQGEGKGNTPCSPFSLWLIRRVQSQVNARTANISGIELLKQMGLATLSGRNNSLLELQKTKKTEKFSMKRLQSYRFHSTKGMWTGKYTVYTVGFSCPFTGHNRFYQRARLLTLARLHARQAEKALQKALACLGI